MNANDVTQKTVTPEEANVFAQKAMAGVAMMATEIAAKVQDENMRLAMGMMADNALSAAEALKGNIVSVLPEGATREDLIAICKERALMTLAECTLVKLGLL